MVATVYQVQQITAYCFTHFSVVLSFLITPPLSFCQSPSLSPSISHRLSYWSGPFLKAESCYNRQNSVKWAGDRCHVRFPSDSHHLPPMSAKTLQTNRDSQLPLTLTYSSISACWCVLVCAGVCWCACVSWSRWERKESVWVWVAVHACMCVCESLYLPAELLELLRLFYCSLSDLLETFYQRVLLPFRAFWPESV